MEPNRGYFTKQITTTEENRHLVLKLKENLKEIEKEKNELESKVQDVASTLMNSQLGQSFLKSTGSPSLAEKNSTIIVSDIEFYLTEADDEEFFSAEEESAEEKYIEFNDKINDLNMKENVIEREIVLASTQINDNEQLGFLDKIKIALKDIASQEGTTFASTGITGAIAMASPIAAPTILGIGAGLALGVIATNEALKMLGRYVDKIAADDHLKAIEGALNNIKTKNEEAHKSVKEAIRMQEKVQNTIGKIDLILPSLEVKLEEASDEMKEIILKAQGRFKLEKEALQRQYYSLQQAILASENSLVLLKTQQGKLQELLDNQYVVTNEADLKKVMADINQKITEIKAISDEIYMHQMTANRAQLDALKMQGELHDIHLQSAEMIANIEILELQIQEAKGEIAGLKEQVNEAETYGKKVNAELEKQKGISEEIGEQIEVSEEQLKRAKEFEIYGQQSIMLGTGFAATAGGIIGGSGGAILGGALLSSYSIHCVHRVRKYMNAWKKIGEEAVMKQLEEDLNKNKLPADVNVSVHAKYAESSQGNYIGSAGIKGLANLGISVLHHVTGSNMEYYSSSNAGTTECTIGNIKFVLNFRKNNPNRYYGAINLDDQLKLNALLQVALLNKNITPETVLKLLNKLSTAKIGVELIMMLNPDSKVFKSLKSKCEKMISKQKK